MFAKSADRTDADNFTHRIKPKHGSMTMLSISPLLMLANSSVAWHNNVTFLHYSFPCAVPNAWACKENVKNEQRAKLAKRAELPRVKLEYAPNCRARIWHRVEVGRAQLDRVKLARVKKDAPNWTVIHELPYKMALYVVDGQDDDRHYLLVLSLSLVSHLLLLIGF